MICSITFPGWGQTDRSVAPHILFLTFPVDGCHICQCPVNWDLPFSQDCWYTILHDPPWAVSIFFSLIVPFLALSFSFSLWALISWLQLYFQVTLALPCLAWTVCKICMWHFFVFVWNRATEPFDEVSLPRNSASTSPDTSLLFYIFWSFALLLWAAYHCPSLLWCMAGSESTIQALFCL